MFRATLAVLLATLLACGCSSDESKPDGVPAPDTAVTKVDKGTTPNPDVNTTKLDKGTTPTSDGPKNKEAQVPTGEPGSVCTQANKTCAAGLTCAFLEAWNAPKGTCLRELKDGCKSYDDPRCVVAGKNYSVMCGPYTLNTVTTNICFLLCVFNGKNYDCPPLHTCKTINGFNTCIPQ